MGRTGSRSIPKLLDAIRDDFPRRKAAAEALMRKLGLDKTLELTMSPSEKAQFVPTFDRLRRRRISPMSKARFDYAGTIRYGLDVWLTAGEMERWIRKRQVRSYHTALREHWEGSAPCLISDRDLSLFVVTEAVPENLTYLVWREATAEPEILSYEGMEEHRFKNLASYLTWRLERK